MRHHHRLYHQFDVVRAGVVRTRLRPLGCVQRPLEQRPEYRRLDVPPVPLAGLAQPLQGHRAEFNGVHDVEQVAVEVGDLVRAGMPAGSH